MFDKILVAVDLAEGKANVLNQAIAIAKASETALRLVNVLNPEGGGDMPMFTYPGLAGYPPVMEDSLWQNYQERYQQYKTRELAKLRRLANQAKPAGVPIELVQEVGSPGRIICEIAASWEADLIVVGSHGRRGLSELLLGSVSNYVMHHAPCSVMIVHPQKAAEAVEKAPELVA
ncbi:MAG: universal stress protein [Cyanobacteria bacterium J06560_6]